MLNPSSAKGAVIVAAHKVQLGAIMHFFTIVHPYLFQAVTSLHFCIQGQNPRYELMLVL